MMVNMKKFCIVCISKKVLFIIIILTIAVMIASIISFRIVNSSAKTFNNSYTKTIVVDPGHGGIDGGTSKGSVLEKDINLDIAKRLKVYLEQKGYKVILTRDTDKSLDSLSNGGGSRHQRDLRARVDIINKSNAQLFLSIHGNCHTKNLDADGSIVLYNERLAQNKTLAYCVQRALNSIIIDGKKRTVHDPQNGSSFYLLNFSKVPGVIIETVFISNQKERELIGQDGFRDDIAKAIADGVERYLNEIKSVCGETN